MWWRIDGTAPTGWTWDGFAAARHRFDPSTGRFRVRYAASTPVAAARERFPDRTITAADGYLHLVTLTAHPSALHLTRQVNLDALGLDDRISTGRLDTPGPTGDPLVATCQQLADLAYDWWQGEPPPIVYRTRSVPRARSLAFSSNIPWDQTDSAPLRNATALLAQLALHHGFIIPDPWLT